jgi:hypothetical protein
MDLYVFGTSNYEEVVLECCLPVWRYVWICIWLAPEWLERFYSYSVLKNFSIQSWCPANLNILAPKIGALETGPKTQNGDFQKKQLKFQ